MKTWWQRRPLWFRLALWYAVVGTVLLAGFSASLFYYVSNRMARPLDHQLRVDLETVRRRLVVREDGRMIWDGRELTENAAWTTQYPWMELWDENGRLVRRLWPFSENRVQQLPIAPAPGRETISVFSVAPDIRLRVLSVPYAAPPGREWMIRLMRIHDPTGDALRALRWIIILALPTVVTLLVFGGYVITRRWLAPLDRIAAEAGRFSADNLSRRLPVENPHDEIGRLAAIMNRTYDRLEAAFTSRDRFVVDASHELRTPLTTLRSVGEVGLRRSRTLEEYREIIASMLEEAQRLQLLVERLLELASAEGGAANARFADVAIDECVRDCVEDLRILAEARDQTIAVNTGPARVVTDAVFVRQALQNLIDNAIKYGPPGGRIEVEVLEAPAGVDIRVSDRGPGIAEADRAKLAERFFRPDRARHRTSGGYGLGLSITVAYARALGGHLRYEARPGGGSVFHLLLPKPATATFHGEAGEITP